MDSVSELVWRGDGVVDGLRSLIDVARGSVGGVCGDVFEVEERFAHPSVRVHHERDEFLVDRCGRGLVLVVLLSLAFRDGGRRGALFLFAKCDGTFVPLFLGTYLGRQGAV